MVAEDIAVEVGTSESGICVKYSTSKCSTMVANVLHMVFALLQRSDMVLSVSDVHSSRVSSSFLRAQKRSKESAADVVRNAVSVLRCFNSILIPPPLPPPWDHNDWTSRVRALLSSRSLRMLLIYDWRDSIVADTSWVLTVRPILSTRECSVSISCFRSCDPSSNIEAYKSAVAMDCCNYTFCYFICSNFNCSTRIVLLCCFWFTRGSVISDSSCNILSILGMSLLGVTPETCN